MKTKLITVIILLSQLVWANEPELNLRCENRGTFLPTPPHIGNILTDQQKVLVQIQNGRTHNFTNTRISELLTVLDPSLSALNFKSVDFEIAREQCRTMNLKISIEGLKDERVLPTLDCSSILNKTTPATVRVHLNDGSVKSYEALIDISLHFEGVLSAWSAGTNLKQLLSIRVLDPKTTWKELAAVEVLGGHGGAVCEPL